MTADEIRASQFESDDGNWESAHWLKEIAAQLADLNAKLATVIEPELRPNNSGSYFPARLRTSPSR